MHPSTSLTFFDDETPKTPWLFTKVQPKHNKDLSIPPAVTSIITCKDLDNNNSRQGIYAMHGPLLSFYEDENAYIPELVLDLSYAKQRSLALSQTSLNYGFILTKNGSSIELRFNEKETLDNWVAYLKNVCVMTNFHEEFKAVKMIGKGSFAKVYLVECKSDGKNYAVKAFAKESIGASNKANPKAIMLNEINLMRALDHDNIIRLFSVHETERSIYLVMELIEGKPLQEALNKGQFKRDFNEKQVMEIIRSILDALAYIASKGIMHRDLKPDNMLLSKSGKIKIVDFGLGTVIDCSEYIFKKCGTPGYIAPEVFRFDPKLPSTAYDDRCDAFSAGCIMFYLLFGYAFFEGVGGSEVLKLNKEYNGFEMLAVLKQEMNNQKSKINKDGINLIIQLVEFDHKKRLTSAGALSHNYFAPLNVAGNNLVRNYSSQDISVKSLGSTQLELPSPGLKNNDGGVHFSFKSELDKSPVSPSRNRFTIKDSLFLDVGKPDMNGKLDSMSNGSANNSILMNKDTGLNSPKAGNSSFSRSNSIGGSKDKKSYRQGAGKNSNFLKAAIFNNMQKNNDSPMFEERSPDRRYSDNLMMTKHKSEDVNRNNYSNTSDGDDDSEDTNEDCKIEFNFSSIKRDSVEMSPSKLNHRVRRASSPMKN